MPTGLYSDPYLKSLIEQRPDLAEQFFQTIAGSEYLEDQSIALCLETPGWVLEKGVKRKTYDYSDNFHWEGTQALENPNFPDQKFAELIQTQEFLESNFRVVMQYPRITQSQINELIKNKDIHVKGLALMHPLGNKEQLVEYLKTIVSKKNDEIYIWEYIYKNVTLTDEIFTILFEKNKNKITASILENFWQNESLTDEQKSLLVLSGFNQKIDESLLFWQHQQLHFNYISSLPFYQILNSLPKKIGSSTPKHISEFNLELIVFFAKVGHPLTSLIRNAETDRIDIDLEGLKNLNSYQLLNRLFWTELCERDDFNINRVNGYRVDNVSISHPILGREFDNTDLEESDGLGGVFMFNDQDWLLGHEELYIDRAHYLLTYDEESLIAIFQERETINNLGAQLISLAINSPELAQKYGFEISDETENWICSVASEYAESDDFDASAELNPAFPELLSWRNLPQDKKKAILDLLALGLKEPDSKLRNDAIHFLGCMALHENTPKELLNELEKLNIPIVAEVLENR